MVDARERLSHLIELAGESTPDKQRALAFELCDLLTDWPTRYPAAMREPFEALLEKVLRRLDGTTRRMIAARLAARPETALAFLNEFYLDVPADARRAILARNADLPEHAQIEGATAEDELPLIEAARRVRGAEFAAALARFLDVTPPLAQRILDDMSGDGLAVACKGAGVRRATYSALALLAGADLRANPAARYERLSAFEDVPAEGARRMLAFWRRLHDDGPPQEPGARAA